MNKTRHHKSKNLKQLKDFDFNKYRVKPRLISHQETRVEVNDKS